MKKFLLNGNVQLICSWLQCCRSFSMMASTLENLFLVVLWCGSWTCFFALNQTLYMDFNSSKIIETEICKVPEK